VFIWFGALKVANTTPVAQLVETTIPFIDPLWWVVPALGGLEVAMGIALVLGRGLRIVLPLFVAHMLSAFGVLVLQPEIAFQHGNPLLTVEGELVAKNVVLLAAGLTVGIRLRACRTTNPAPPWPPHDHATLDHSSEVRIQMTQTHADDPGMQGPVSQPAGRAGLRGRHRNSRTGDNPMRFPGPLRHAPPDRQPGTLAGHGLVPAGRRLVLLALAGLLALALGACGSAQRPPAAAGGGPTVTIQDLAYTPQALTVAAGATVTWVFGDGAIAHDVNGPGFHSKVQSEGTFGHRFTQPGTYAYLCTLHPNMTGVIEVTR
jgi:putative oxidoreductase